jgi:hypothetical protein
LCITGFAVQGYRRSQKRGEEEMDFFCDQFWFCEAMPPEWHWVIPLGMPLLLLIIVAGEYPASSWPQPMVDNPRVCAAGKSDRLMGVCVHPMAQPHLGRWPAGVSSAVCSRAGGPRARNPAPAHGLAGPDEVKRHGEK